MSITLCIVLWGLTLMLLGQPFEIFIFFLALANVFSLSSAR